MLSTCNISHVFPRLPFVLCFWWSSSCWAGDVIHYYSLGKGKGSVVTNLPSGPRWSLLPDTQAPVKVPSTLTCATNGWCGNDGMVFPRLVDRRHHVFCLILSWITYSEGGAHCCVVRTLHQPHGEVYVARSWGFPFQAEPSCEGVLLEVDPPSLVKPSGDCGPHQHLDGYLTRDPELELSS